MRYMKILMLWSVVFLIIFLIGCKSQFKYTEGDIYFETVLKGYNNSNQELTDFLTRDKAIEYAQSIFKDGFNIKINRDKLRESMYLTKAGGDFYWNIVWDEIENNMAISQYYILLSSSTGKIKSCGVARFNKDKEYYYDYYATNEEIDNEDLELVLDISKPMIEKMNINIEEYVVNGVNKGGRKVLILKNEQQSYEFVVDIEIRELISFTFYGGDWK